MKLSELQGQNVQVVKKAAAPTASSTMPTTSTTAPLKLSSLKPAEVTLKERKADVEKEKNPTGVTPPKTNVKDMAIPSFITGVARDLYQRGQNVSQLEKDSMAGKENPILAGTHMAGEVARGVGDIFSEAGKTIFTHLLSPMDQAKLKEYAGDYDKAVKYVSDKITNVPAITNALNHVNDFMDKNPEAVKTADDLTQLTLLALSDTPSQKAVSRIGDVAEGANALIKNEVIPSVENAGKKTVGEALSKGQDAKEFLKERAVSSIENTYRETAGQTKGATKTLEKSVARGKDPARFLAERNITPDVVDGKMKTAGAKAKVMDNVAPLNEHLNLALDELQPSVQLTDLNDLRSRALRSVDQLKNISETARRQIKAHINEELDLQIEANGEKVPLSKVNDIKKAMWGETKFDMTKPYFSTATYQLGNAAKTLIEDSVPKDAFAIKELNSYIGDHYDAIKFLDSLESKAVKGGRLGKYVARTIGTLMGSSLGIPGEVLGFLGGGSVSEMLQSMTFSNPLKELILKNIKTADPEAYQKILSFIQQAQGERAGRAALPSPSFIPMGEFKGGESKVVQPRAVTPEELRGAQMMTGTTPKPGALDGIKVDFADTNPPSLPEAKLTGRTTPAPKKGAFTRIKKKK